MPQNPFERQRQRVERSVHLWTLFVVVIAIVVSAGLELLAQRNRLDRIEKIHQVEKMEAPDGQ